jgi:hypothetical protein
MISDKYILVDYSVADYKIISDYKAQVSVSYKYKVTENGVETFLEVQDALWDVVKEKNVWKVKRDKALN